MSNLEDRVRAAFEPGVTSAVVSALIGVVEFAASDAGQKAAAANKTAIDPTIPSGDVLAARAAADDAQHRQARLNEALRQLRERLAAVTEDERQSRLRDSYAQVLAELTAVEDEISARYPVLAAELTGFLARLQAAHTRVNHINAVRNLPAGAGRIRPAFEHLVAGVKLPALGTDAHHALWPPRANTTQTFARPSKPLVSTVSIVVVAPFTHQLKGGPRQIVVGGLAQLMPPLADRVIEAGLGFAENSEQGRAARLNVDSTVFDTERRQIAAGDKQVPHFEFPFASWGEWADAQKKSAAA